MLTKELLAQANEVYLENFPPTTCFERAIFFSWYCETGDCAFCYMSSQKGKAQKLAVRTPESLIVEALLCKKLGWKIGFISGGHKAYTKENFTGILEKISLTADQKLWLNIGALTEDEIKSFLPYTEGLIAAIETVNPKIHKIMCPSKPIEPFLKMFKLADKYGLKKGMTIILGLGETIADFERLNKFIQKHNITKISFYSLNPQKGTLLENYPSPTVEYQAEWVAKTRIFFPKIDIQAGIWANKVDKLELLLTAGANSITKFPAISRFNAIEAQLLIKQCIKAKRTFQGTLTKLPNIDVKAEVDALPFSQDLKAKTAVRLESYLKTLCRKKSQTFKYSK